MSFKHPVVILYREQRIQIWHTGFTDGHWIFCCFKTPFFLYNYFSPKRRKGNIDYKTPSQPYISKGPDGKALFSQNCASCHAVNKQLTGPALAGVLDRVPDRKLLYQWIKDNEKVLKSRNPYFVKLYDDFNKTSMNKFPNLTEEEIDAILDYISVENLKPKALTVPTASFTTSILYNSSK